MSLLNNQFVFVGGCKYLSSDPKLKLLPILLYEVDGLLAQLDRDNNEKLEWGEFLEVVAMQVVEGRRERASDVKSAFIALGGAHDCTGKIHLSLIS